MTATINGAASIFTVSQPLWDGNYRFYQAKEPIETSGGKAELFSPPRAPQRDVHPHSLTLDASDRYRPDYKGSFGASAQVAARQTESVHVDPRFKHELSHFVAFSQGSDRIARPRTAEDTALQQQVLNEAGLTNAQATRRTMAVAPAAHNSMRMATVERPIAVLLSQGDEVIYACNATLLRGDDGNITHVEEKETSTIGNGSNCTITIELNALNYQPPLHALQELMQDIITGIFAQAKAEPAVEATEGYFSEAGAGAASEENIGNATAAAAGAHNKTPNSLALLGAGFFRSQVDDEVARALFLEGDDDGEAETAAAAGPASTL